MNYRLTKSERLHADKLIKELFNEGSSFFLYPFKVLLLRKIELAGQTNQVLISVSKKKIKKAAGRNYIKRRVREAYRIHKQILDSDGMLIGFIFVGKPEMSFGDIEPKMIQILSKIAQDHPEKITKP
ncbi:ribonuclease P protein component [Algoriphagus boseongensis]|uniref:Ribonuclease P protein component n=1 Tax=Algoriphagus boseongensis TaxID=1442587 RepID=A0A4R6T5N5_9BACT|nr:ribonuclease P protein component [Algoriphagus boseongensis]TDQ17663.1 ribonuclease P protein component [Algoriphagus boseongensis]